MSCYQRPRRAAARVFFTVCLARPGTRLLTDEIVSLREAVRVTRQRRPFGIDAWVVLPDHMHAVCTLPEGDANYSDRWGSIKARFSKFLRLKQAEVPVGQNGKVGYKPTLRPADASGLTEAERLRRIRSASKRGKQDAGIWQQRFWEHHIRDQADYHAHVRYCWINPVKHGLVSRAADWPYSSIRRDIAAGRVDPQFVGEIVDGDFSEIAAPGEGADQRRVGL
ncbi:transposase [Thalassococcus sp. BH17M4-6]|uniref:transposase n=1 Tax=Thalassococcus sp. BH17M4-6 TaxID=3413148 RepID=UPI003BC92664